MATSVQARAQSRGFPVLANSGLTGAGALQDDTLPVAAVPPGMPVAPFTDPNSDPASVPAALPAPDAYVTRSPMWGLPGALNPDDTPRTHAAPMADDGLLTSPGDGEAIGEYYVEADATHSAEFNGVEIRHHPGINPMFGFDRDIIPGSPPGPLAKTEGQQRVMGGFDGVQGYGGGADGINGTNATMPLTVTDRFFPGPEGNPTFLNTAEVPFLDVAALQFIASAPELPPFTGVYDGPNANSRAQDPIAGDVPATGPPLSSAPAGLLPQWGGF